MEHIDKLFYKLRFITFSLLLIAGLLMLTLLLSYTVGNNSPVKNTRVSSGFVASNTTGTANTVTSGLFTVAAGVERSLSSTETTIKNGLKSAVSSVSNVGSFATAGVMLAVRSIGDSAAFASESVVGTLASMGKAAGSGAATVLRAPFSVMGFLLDTPAANALIRPSAHTSVPVIDAGPALISKENPALLPALAPVSQPTHTPPQPLSEAASWPIHGNITTHFGVPHWPYQPTHTGIDISDGRSAGVTPVKPFRSGTVIETVRSYRGLGNFVVVDHGGGMTSLYGHLASIAVQKGQLVDKATTLGMEGSTGASTGTHLHFEIRVNGQPVNPLPYLNGRP